MPRSGMVEANFLGGKTLKKIIIRYDLKFISGSHFESYFEVSKCDHNLVDPVNQIYANLLACSKTRLSLSDIRIAL